MNDVPGVSVKTFRFARIFHLIVTEHRCQIDRTSTSHLEEVWFKPRLS
jgi:hypothetical protein